MKTLLLCFLFVTQIDYSIPPVWVPGAINPNVTQANIASTICTASWTKTIRPTVRFTNALKISQMVKLKLLDDASHYEEDHRVPLEVGGAPHDASNLWPEPWPEAREKDRLETAIKRDVCSGALTLAEGQAVFLGNFWDEYLRRFGK